MPGWFSRNGLQPCIACPFGFYQPNAGQSKCLRCPEGSVTLQPSATTLLQCTSNQTHIFFSANFQVYAYFFRFSQGNCVSLSVRLCRNQLINWWLLITWGVKSLIQCSSSTHLSAWASRSHGQLIAGRNHPAVAEIRLHLTKFRKFRSAACIGSSPWLFWTVQ